MSDQFWREGPPPLAAAYGPAGAGEAPAPGKAAAPPQVPAKRGSPNPGKPWAWLLGGVALTFLFGVPIFLLVRRRRRAR